MRVAKVAGRKLTWWQYDQTSWSAREWMPFALQRLSVQLWVALADEAQRAIDWQQNNNLLIGERDF